MNPLWYEEIEDTIVSYIDYKLRQTLVEFPDLFVTTEISDDYPKFPTVAITQLEPLERGQDLDNTTINAILSTFQIMVTDNESRERCRKVLNECLRLMKAYRFNVIGMPIFTKTDTDSGRLYQGVIRCRRLIGNGDKDF